MADDDARDPAIGIDRREAMRLAAAATLTASLGVRGVLAQERAPRALTGAEFSLLDELAEQIIPTDSHSPGARAAGVAAYIDGRLAEAWTEAERTEWRSGLQAIDEECRRITGKSFMDAAVAERIAVLTTLAAKETSPGSAAEKFFVTLKSAVAFAYYTSEIGIKQEMQYQGNVYLNEFVGIDVRTEKV